MDIKNIVYRRVLLSKDFFLNAKSLHLSNDSVSKIISIHNFHIAVEIALKSVLLHYNIRSEKTLSVTVETMINDIEKFDFHDKSYELPPFKQEVLQLSKARNLAQHAAVEPDRTYLEEVFVITRKFLELLFKTYFDIEFEKINRISLVDCPCIRLCMESGCKHLEDSDHNKAAQLFSMAMHLSINAIERALVRTRQSIFLHNRDKNGDVARSYERDMREIYNSIGKSSLQSIILSSGVKFSEYIRFLTTIPSTTFSMNGTPHFNYHHLRHEIKSENALWAKDFVTDCIINWQRQGLVISLDEHLIEGCTIFLSEVSDTHPN